MSAAKNKQNDKHLNLLRGLGSLPDNKHCFDCHQCGPTYINLTIGAYVCTSCSGLLRGLNPPHRVKSISMGNFSSEEMDSVKRKGNWFCKKTWLALFEESSAVECTQNQLRDLLTQKYERRQFYVPPSPEITYEALRINSEVCDRAESGGGGCNRLGGALGKRCMVEKNASKSVIIAANRGNSASILKLHTSFTAAPTMTSTATVQANFFDFNTFLSNSPTAAKVTAANEDFANFAKHRSSKEVLATSSSANDRYAPLLNFNDFFFASLPSESSSAVTASSEADLQWNAFGASSDGWTTDSSNSQMSVSANPFVSGNPFEAATALSSSAASWGSGAQASNASWLTAFGGAELLGDSASSALSKPALAALSTNPFL